MRRTEGVGVERDDLYLLGYNGDVAKKKGCVELRLRRRSSRQPHKHAQEEKPAAVGALIQCSGHESLLHTK